MTSVCFTSLEGKTRPPPESAAPIRLINGIRRGEGSMADALRTMVLAGELAPNEHDEPAAVMPPTFAPLGLSFAQAIDPFNMFTGLHGHFGGEVISTGGVPQIVPAVGDDDEEDEDEDDEFVDQGEDDELVALEAGNGDEEKDETESVVSIQLPPSGPDPKIEGATVLFGDSDGWGDPETATGWNTFVPPESGRIGRSWADAGGSSDLDVDAVFDEPELKSVEVSMQVEKHARQIYDEFKSRGPTDADLMTANIAVEGVDQIMFDLEIRFKEWFAADAEAHPEEFVFTAADQELFDAGEFDGFEDDSPASTPTGWSKNHHTYSSMHGASASGWSGSYYTYGDIYGASGLS